MVTVKESPNAKGVCAFKYNGPNGQITVNDVTIMFGNVYETDSETEIFALRAKKDYGVQEIKRKEPGEVSHDTPVDEDEDAE